LLLLHPARSTAALKPTAIAKHADEPLCTRTPPVTWRCVRAWLEVPARQPWLDASVKSPYDAEQPKRDRLQSVAGDYCSRTPERRGDGARSRL